MFSIASTTDQESAQYLLPIQLSSSLASTANPSSAEENSVTTTSSLEVASSSKKRRKPEKYQEELLEEMQSQLQEMRKRMIQLLTTSTKAKVNQQLIRDKKRIQTQKRQQKKWNQLMKLGACTDLAYYHIHPDLASLLHIPPNTFVRRDDVRTLIAAYVRSHQLAKKGVQVELSEELKKVIGPEWTAKLQEGRARFNNFTFERIAKERHLFGDKAPQPGPEQTREILAILDNTSELTN